MNDLEVVGAIVGIVVFGAILVWTLWAMRAHP